MNRLIKWADDAIRLRSIRHGLRSPHWPKVSGLWRQSHPTCAACGSLRKVQVHHIKPFHLFPELELVTTNLISLCEVKTIGGNHHLLFGHSGNWTHINAAVVHDAARALRDHIIATTTTGE